MADDARAGGVVAIDVLAEVVHGSVVRLRVVVERHRGQGVVLVGAVLDDGGEHPLVADREELRAIQPRANGAQLLVAGGPGQHDLLVCRQREPGVGDAPRAAERRSLGVRGSSRRRPVGGVGGRGGPCGADGDGPGGEDGGGQAGGVDRFSGHQFARFS